MLGPKADAAEHVLDRAAPLGGTHGGVHLDRLLDDGADLLPRVERAVRVLEHDLDGMAQLAALLGRSAGDVDAVDRQLTGGRRFDQRDQAGKGALAAAGLADHGQRPAFDQLEARAAQRLKRGRAPEHAAAHGIVTLEIFRLEDQSAIGGPEVGHALASA